MIPTERPSAMRILFICGDQQVTALVTRTVAEAGVEVTAISASEAIELHEADAVLLWHEETRKVTRSRRLELLGLRPRVPVVVAMRLEDVPTMAESALLGAGIVFVDANLSRLVEIVHLTRAGYMLLPKDFTIDRLRSLAERRQDTSLDDLDLAVLAALGEGLTYRQISERLHVRSIVMSARSRPRRKGRSRSAIG
jgi:DNA-binding NarL/FixJ family response regulator